MDINIKGNILKAQYCIDNGVLRCIDSYYVVIHEEKNIRICIEEVGERIITLSCEDGIEVTKLYSVLLRLERLLQIFDGAFIPLVNITIYGNESDSSYNSLIEDLKVQRLRYFLPANFLAVTSDRIINYEEILSEKIFDEWNVLLDDLGVVNQMYLYATSDCGFTNDVKCAFLVELAESLIEIIGKDNISLLKKSDSELG